MRPEATYPWLEGEVGTSNDESERSTERDRLPDSRWERRRRNDQKQRTGISGRRVDAQMPRASRITASCLPIVSGDRRDQTDDCKQHDVLRQQPRVGVPISRSIADRPWEQDVEEHDVPFEGGSFYADRLGEARIHSSPCQLRIGDAWSARSWRVGGKLR